MSARGRSGRLTLQVLLVGLVLSAAACSSGRKPATHSATAARPSPPVLQSPPANPQSAPQYILAFEERPPFHFLAPTELFAALTESYPQGVQIHDFRTRAESGKLVGIVCVDGAQGKDAIVAMIRKSPKIVLKDCGRATEAGLEEVRAMGQPSLPTR